MAIATDGNPSIAASSTLPGFDVATSEYKIATRIVNIQTDTSVTPNVIYGDLVTAIPSGVGFISDYPVGATPLTASSGNVTNATASATLSGSSGKTTFLAGFDVTSTGATLAGVVTVTITNLISGTLSYVYSVIAGVVLKNDMLSIQFRKPIPANAINTVITVSCPALGAGNTNHCVNAYGYQL